MRGLRLIARGFSNAEIAQSLVVSENDREDAMSRAC